MALHELPKIVTPHHRVGRGIGSRGAKSGRGQKGQRSRAGSYRKAGFEGGQTPLYMRLPKGRGSKQKFPSQIARPTVVTTTQLRQFAASSIVGPGAVREAGLTSRRIHRLKLVAGAAVPHQLTVRAHAATPAARQIIEAAGGTVELITESPK